MIQQKLKDQHLLESKDFSLLEEPLLKKEESTEGLYYKEDVLAYLKNYIEHYNKVGLIWGLSTLTRSNLFGKNPLSSYAPVGMGTIDNQLMIGKGLISSSVFFQDSKEQVKRSLEKFAKLPIDFLSPHLDVITPSHVNHIFLGNTLKLEEGIGANKREGYLTVGTHGGPILGSLARSTHQIALFISGNRIITVRTPEGEMMEDEQWFHIPTEPLLSKPSGIINVGGEEFFFLHIVPYKSVDLHFFIFNPKEKEFAFINSINEGAKEVIDNLSLQMRLAALGGLLFVLLFLNNIAKRITKPITHLADVTEEVAKGNLEDITIPEEPRKKTKDEIYSLYHSFFKMVQGLREKEKMKGVLNKVVSEEIAEEALKGNIQLGGEEKNVTVFFADIRGFTQMTEKMNPKEVIQFVNGCMTKVSEKIDKYEGVIDKYVGDEVMALFGAPIEKKEGAVLAIQSGLETIQELKEWNKKRAEQHLPEIAMGIGIHTGNVVAGNMGAENRLNYTVLGANVNLAARICSKAKGMQILISEATLHAEGVEKRFICEKLQAVELKGFSASVNIYEVKGYKDHHQNTG
jgi:class 3 adenylate cyclase